MTMSETNPPIASGNLNKDRIVSDADMFENFAVHYSKLLHNNKKKVREQLQQHAPRRSPRLADKKLSVDTSPFKNKKNKKSRRSYSIISESNPEALIPVMQFSELKNRRRIELLTSELKGKQTPSNVVDIDEVIEIKDDDSISGELAEETIGTSGFNDREYRDDCEEVQIRIEETSSVCSSSDEMPEPMQEEHCEQQQYMQHEYIHNYEQHVYTQNCSQPGMYSNQMPCNGMYSVASHQYYQPYAPQSYVSQNSPSQFIPSVPPPSLTPESPAYSPCPESQPMIPSQLGQNMSALPFNTHVRVNSVQPSFESEGKTIRSADISLRFGPFHLIMRGYIMTTTLADHMFLETVFIPNFSSTDSVPNNMPQYPFPQPTPNPEFMCEREKMTEPTPGDFYQNYAPRENDILNERLNIVEVDETMDESVTEEAPIPMEYGANGSQDNYNDLRDMEIDSSSDDEDVKEFSYDILNPFPDNPERSLPMPHTTMVGKIRLRTDLTNDGFLSNVFAMNDADDLPVLIYLKYECDTDPRFFIVHNNILYQGVSGLTVFKDIFWDPWLEKVRTLTMYNMEIKEEVEEELD